MLHQFAVDPGGDHAAVGLDHHAVPLVRLVGAVERRQVAVDGHGRVLDFAGLVENLQFHAVARGPAFFRGADGYARVAATRNSVFEGEREVGVLLVGPQIGEPDVRDVDDVAVIDTPLALVVVDEPAAQILAIKQRVAAWLAEAHVGERGFALRHRQRQTKAAVGVERKFAGDATVDDD